MFDDAFRTFWRRPPGEWSADDLRAMGEQRRLGPPQVDIPSESGSRSAGGASLPDPVERVAAMTYSDREISRTKDFAEFTDVELEEARRTLALLSWDVGQRRTREPEGLQPLGDSVPLSDSISAAGSLSSERVRDASPLDVWHSPEAIRCRFLCRKNMPRYSGIRWWKASG